MTRNQLLAFAAALASTGAGVYLYKTGTGELTTAFPSGGMELLRQSEWTAAACNATLCVQGDNVLSDAGSPCSTRLFTGPVRIGAVARAWAQDAGLTIGTQRYQRARLIGLRCPAIDGGSAFAVPMKDVLLDDGGISGQKVPQFASYAQVTPPCVRAPLDGGTDCLELGAQVDGGARFIGTANVFPASLAQGTQCEPVECAVVFGDDAEVDL